MHAHTRTHTHTVLVGSIEIANVYVYVDSYSLRQNATIIADVDFAEDYCRAPLQYMGLYIMFLVSSAW